MSNLSDRGTLRGTLQRNSGNYNDLINKPAINGHTLIGNQSGHALGLANEDDIINIEANPLGPATADLHKILVDDTIYSIPDVVVYGTASGAIASFDDGGDNKPLKSLKVAIDPVQSGSGDPSPSNVRPISGWTGANVYRTGANVWDEQWEGGAYNNTTGGYQPNASCIRCKNKIKVKPNASYYMQIGSTSGLNICQYDVNGNYLGVSTLIQCTTSKVITTNVNCGYLTFYWLGTSYNNDISLNSNSTDTIYHAYNATTYPITWSDEIMGGELDVTDGVIHPYKYYPSYNGETLVGEWLSSMDVYAEGTTPTIGAQVVDFGAYDTDITVECPTITTLLGNNNIWSNTGEIEECVYQRDINIALNKALNQ